MEKSEKGKGILVADTYLEHRHATPQPRNQAKPTQIYFYDVSCHLLQCEVVVVVFVVVFIIYILRIILCSKSQSKREGEKGKL